MIDGENKTEDQGKSATLFPKLHQPSKWNCITCPEEVISYYCYIKEVIMYFCFIKDEKAIGTKLHQPSKWNSIPYPEEVIGYFRHNKEVIVYYCLIGRTLK